MHLLRCSKKYGRQHNENYAIAAVFAARLGLEQVIHTDDHTSAFTIADEVAFATAMRAA